MTLKEALFKSLKKDGSLYMPSKISKFPQKFFKNIDKLTFQEIALEITKAFFKNDVTEKDLKKIVNESITFDAPVKKISKDIFVLELFHGPTLAFKDFGAAFLARLIKHFLKKNEKLIVLAATSGDTGSAVGKGFYETANVQVSLLYPSGKISKIQEKQLTTIGKNVQALEVKGTFDDCQKLVKEAFKDQKLKTQLAAKSISLTSANSINIGRLLPQTFYYFYAYAQLKKPLVISVPSGNFGNLTAGLIAKKMGLPVKKFIAATNANDTFPNYLKTGKFKPKSSIKTISNAMDVGNPNNFPRILKMYRGNLEKIRKDIWSKSFTDKETKEAIKEVYQKYNYLMDPHGAVGYLGLKAYLKNLKTDSNCAHLFLETAHPSKFLDVIEPIIKKKISMPKSLSFVMKKKKKSLKLANNYKDFKSMLSEL